MKKKQRIQISLIKSKSMSNLIYVILLIINSCIVTFVLFSQYIIAKLPKSIPFTLNYFNLFLLIITCIGVIIRLVLLCKRNIHTNLFKTIKKYVIPLIDVLIKIDKLIKNSSQIKEKYNNILISFLKRKDNIKLIESTITIEYILRSIFTMTFLLDVFFFHILHYTYKLVFIFPIILLFKYIIYSLRETTNKLFNEIDNDIDLLCTSNVKAPLLILEAKQLAHIQVSRSLKKKETIDYTPSYKIEFLNSERLRLGLDNNKKFSAKSLRAKGVALVDTSIALYKIIYLYDLKRQEDVYKYFILYVLQIIGWLYILFVSLNTFPYIVDLLDLCIKYIPKVEPFSNIEL